MPYIPQACRARLDAAISAHHKGCLCETSGEMNYCLTKMWLQQAPPQAVMDFVCAIWRKNPRYDTANAIAGAYMLSLREVNRRKNELLRSWSRPIVSVLQDFCDGCLDPYEDKKIAENGDLPEFGVHQNADMACTRPAKAPAKTVHLGAKRKAQARTRHQYKRSGK